MNYCKFHPLKASTYECESCMRSVCDECADAQSPDQILCFYCQKKMRSLGDAQQAEPFWRRLEQSFKYPLNANSLILIIALSLLNIVLSFFPLAFLWQIFLTAAMVSYCFSCLNNTAQGEMSAPDITAAYEGGLILLFKLFAVFAIAAVFGVTAFTFLGVKLGIVISFFVACCLPASIILLSLSGDFLHAINPRHQVSLVAAIGWGYALLLCFIIMMSASVSSISVILLGELNWLSSIVSSMVTNFYMVVMFHIMSYMVYQYQAKLGFSARSSFNDSDFSSRSDEKRLLQKAEMSLKEGDVEHCLKQLIKGVKVYPSAKEFKLFAFELLLDTGSAEDLNEFGSYYLEYLISSQQELRITVTYKRIIAQQAEFKADKAHVRLMLAKLFFEKGDFIQTVKILNGLHKDFAGFENLSEAFEIMSKALEHIPGKQQQAEKAKMLASHYA